MTQVERILLRYPFCTTAEVAEELGTTDDVALRVLRALWSSAVVACVRASELKEHESLAIHGRAWVWAVVRRAKPRRGHLRIAS